MSMATIITKAGFAFVLRIVRKGDDYGKDFCLTHDDEEPMVEFYDERFLDKFPPLGQFVTRYNADRFLARSAGGLDLHGGVEAWSLDEETYLQAQLWVRSELGRED